MKTLKEQLNESLKPQEIKTLKQLGFKQYMEDKETWFEALIDNRLIRITQEEVGKDDWWNVKVESDYLLDADKKPMAFQTPQEAAEEVIQQINNKLI
jgi:predicted acylesterase/phospholipase RssA